MLNYLLKYFCFSLTRLLKIDRKSLFVSLVTLAIFLKSLYSFYWTLRKAHKTTSRPPTSTQTFCPRFPWAKINGVTTLIKEAAIYKNLSQIDSLGIHCMLTWGMYLWISTAIHWYCGMFIYCCLIKILQLNFKMRTNAILNSKLHRRGNENNILVWR